MPPLPQPQAETLNCDHQLSSDHATSESELSLSSSATLSRGENPIVASNSAGSSAGTPEGSDVLADPVGAELVRRRLRSRMFGASEHGLGVDRFTLLEQIGTGGMGRVYAAWDEQLTRRVALKLLHRQDHKAQLRVMREAQAQARVAHPNVVPIHDVGVDEGQLWLAMEYVEGQTLGDWIQAETPSWRETLQVLVQAGQGLLAAHRAGLVHRDFKPSNVMLGQDGRARVLDFGLARGLQDSGTGSDTLDSLSQSWGPTGSNSGAGSNSGTGSNSGLLDRSVTVRGSLLGTPAYMAPEQFDARGADELSDQFSFCVAAYECLFGYRPFQAKTLPGLSEAICAGKIQPPPRDTKAPRAVVAAILRGLSPAPHDRFPALLDLLEVLESALAPSRARVLLAGAAALAMIAGLAGVALARDRDDPRCAIEASALAGAWSPARRATVHAALGESAPAPLDRLDTWAEHWLAAAAKNCQATHVEGMQSERMFERRGLCLERQRDQFEAIVDRLDSGLPEVVSHSAELLAELPDLRRCGLEAVDSLTELPSDPQLRIQVLTGYAHLAEARALLVTQGLGATSELLSDLESGPARLHLPLALELEGLRAQLSLERDDTRAFVARLQAAIDRSVNGRNAQIEADLRVQLAHGSAGEWSVPEAQQLLIDEARRGLDRLGEHTGRRHLTLLRARARTEHLRGRYTEARALYLEARTLAEQLMRDEDRVYIELGLADLARRLEQFEAAEDAYTRATELAEGWGTQGTFAELIAFNRGLLALDKGELERALEQLERARSIRVALWGEGSLPVAQADFALAKAAAQAGDFDRGRQLCAAVQAIFEAELDPDDEELGNLFNALGVFEFYADAFPASIVAYRRSLAIATRVHGPGHEEVALIHSNIGESQLALGHGAEADASFAHALAIYALSPEIGETHNNVAYALSGQGQARLLAGQLEAAVAPLERAVAIHERTQQQPVDLATARFALAQALRPTDTARSQALAERARASFDQLGLEARTRECETWLAEAQ